jgi:hypothetical protein
MWPLVRLHFVLDPFLLLGSAWKGDLSGETGEPDKNKTFAAQLRSFLFLARSLLMSWTVMRRNFVHC